METTDDKTHIDRKYYTCDLNKRLPGESIRSYRSFLTNSGKGAAHGVFDSRHSLFLLREDIILPDLNKTSNTR